MSDFSFLAWFIPALTGSSVLTGVLVQFMIHRTRRHITQNIVDLAEAAVKVGDREVLGQVAQLISRETVAQSPRRINRRRRYEAAAIVLVVTISLAVGLIVGGSMYVDEVLKAGTMRSEQADSIMTGGLTALLITVAAAYAFFEYARLKHSAGEDVEAGSIGSVVTEPLRS
ncbi:hypothetical protein [Arthrobacter sp. VKM Ac-2550]|uniref:hypothetical protein n=1 Tax=Crystallibacter permensis TaxID=1938888 RepID=UPI00222605C0|nr:hypothetical protein [Arthrobacter sp. VKM Ac-2550]MCW2132110.1 hypothetical protein [Arthrobacter sp. VKM Ac-2550]